MNAALVNLANSKPFSAELRRALWYQSAEALLYAGYIHPATTGTHTTTAWNMAKGPSTTLLFRLCCVMCVTVVLCVSCRLVMILTCLCVCPCYSR